MLHNEVPSAYKPHVPTALNLDITITWFSQSTIRWQCLMPMISSISSNIHCWLTSLCCFNTIYKNSCGNNFIMLHWHIIPLMLTCTTWHNTDNSLHCNMLHAQHALIRSLTLDMIIFCHLLLNVWTICQYIFPYGSYSNQGLIFESARRWV